MKKGTLLLVLLFLSTLGFSQNKAIADAQMALDSNSIDTIVKDRENKPIPNPGNDPLIDQINKLEIEYLKLKASYRHRGMLPTGETASSLSRPDTTSKNEVFKAYIKYLKKKIKEEKHKGNLLEFDAEIDARHQQKKKLLKQGDPNANRYDFGTDSKVKINKLDKSKTNNSEKNEQ